VVLPLLAATWSISGFRPSAASQPAVKLAVITPIALGEARLDIDDLRAIFLRKRLAWSGGQRIVAINQPPGSAVRLAFDKSVLGFSADQVARFWIDARIRFGTQAPRTIAGDAMIINVVRLLPGSIGYVPAERVTAAVRVVARVDSGRVLPP
jgi:ABC-type phosphate transport system substrate-binding protein